MLEDQVAYLLQRYLGNYVLGLSKEALKISVWRGDVELTNMQLKPGALNALNLPVKVKAGFLGSVKLKVPWSRIGQDPVLVSLDRIYLIAEPATQVEGYSEDAVQQLKKSRIREMEMKLLETRQILTSEMNKSWLGSLINTVIGNLKLSISSIHIKYEDLESNPGHPFAAGVTLKKLSAVTVDDSGREAFVTGGALEHLHKSVELEELAVYLDSDIIPWHIDKPWEDLLPFEWDQVFSFGTKDGKPANSLTKKHTYMLQPVTGNAQYSKQRSKESVDSNQPLQKAVVNLDDVTLCLPKDGYRDLLKLADNFAAFNQRLKYSHYRPAVMVKSDPKAWWKYACKVVLDQMKKASGKMSWEHVLRYASLRKRYISLYASLLKSYPGREVVDDDKDIEELDRELDIELILQWRMLAHKFVEQSMESELYTRKQKAKTSWWSFGWNGQSSKEDNEPEYFTDEDLNRLNEIIGYKEEDAQLLATNDPTDFLQMSLEVHMKHNASKLIEARECVVELSCENLDCLIKLYSEAKVFDVKLGSYMLSSPNGLIAESATSYDSLVGVFCYKPFDAELDWSMVAKASPCYVTYLKDSIDRIINFFESNAAVSQAIALETAAAVQLTIDEVKRTAQQEVNRALKDHSRFFLDLDIAAPKVTIPTDFYPDNHHGTKLLLDFGNLVIRTQDDSEAVPAGEMNTYFQFDLVLSDVSAFLVDGDYHWSRSSLGVSAGSSSSSIVSFLPVIDKCGVTVNLQQIRLEDPSYPSTRLAVRLPSLGFHFSPARYHRLMQVAKIFQGEDSDNGNLLRPWDQSDFEGWLSLLSWKGVGGREAVWQRRYICLVGPFLYVLEEPGSRSYKQYIRLRGKQIYQIPSEIIGNVENVLAVCDAERFNSKVVEDVNALILRCESEDSGRSWQMRLQGAIYRASGTARITGLSETSSDSGDSEVGEHENRGLKDLSKVEKLFITGVLDELKLCFNYSPQKNPTFMMVLLADESRLFELRAIGGRVELSMRANDMFIGTVLKALEVEDLVCGKGVSQPCYLARSFIRSADAPSVFTGSKSFDNNDRGQIEGDDDFYEASENLNDIPDSPAQPEGKYLSPQSSLSFDRSILKTSSFNRVSGLLPGDIQASLDNIDVTDTLDSFVKAQIVIYDSDSVLYDGIDKQVTVTLATLSFYCRRPTILAIMEFVGAINIEDDSCESFSDTSSTAVVNDISREVSLGNQQSATVEEPIMKGLLGKGKSRIIFFLTLNMARAQILLMNENGTKLATMSQDNFLTDIKVFPSSFSIKASLGNLRISDDSLLGNHIYFWACDMRNPGGSSFVELVFSSFNPDDEDYDGYDYSLMGQLSEVRFVYLNRFIQEIISYFMGLVPNNPVDIVKVKDQVTNSEKLFTASEIEGSPAVKLDLSLRKPIILMPRRTNSLDYLKLDIVHITVQNTFRWFGGTKRELSAVHMDILTVMVEDINLNVGTGTELGESIIQDVNGVSIVVQRSLRDLLHQVPDIEVAVKIGELKAALSNREYQIISECALENFSETPNIVPRLRTDAVTSVESTELVPQGSEADGTGAQNEETWVSIKVSVVIGLVQMCLHCGIARDASLATVQVSGLWLLYKSNTIGEGFLSATLKAFTVIDDREGTEQELRLAVRQPESVQYSSVEFQNGDDDILMAKTKATKKSDTTRVPTMLILDANFSQLSSSVSLCIQRPQLLVALDFLLAVVEFFAPNVRSMLSDEEGEKSSFIVDALILDQSTYCQPSTEFSLSPKRPLVADDERFDHFIYDGNGGTLYLQDRQGQNLSSPSIEAIIYVGSGKMLQFKNVTIKNGRYLDSCISLGSNSSYSALVQDQVYSEGWEEVTSLNSSGDTPKILPSPVTTTGGPAEFSIELQVISPELTFYNTSTYAGNSSALSNKLLHAQLDAFCRFVSKGDTIELSANALGLTVESNGIRILEPFDTSVKFSIASGKTNIHVAVSDIFMNFSFSTLRLFLAVEEDILAFLRMTSRKLTVVCSEYDKIGAIKGSSNDQIFVFWKPRAPPGFAVLGDYLTPIDKPPTKGVLAVNTSFVRVKRPEGFILLWPPSASNDISDSQDSSLRNVPDEGDEICSIWFPVAPKGYVALGCVVAPGRTQPPLSSAYCILGSLVSPCVLRDCITISSINLSSSLAFWRVDNSVGTFLPADSTTLRSTSRGYELRHILFGFREVSSQVLSSSDHTSRNDHIVQTERSSTVNSGLRSQPVASFRLVWWNQGSGSRKILSIWRPVVPQGMVYFGDIAVKGYEPPNTCIVLPEDDETFKAPLDFQFVGQIKKHRGAESVSIWLPQAPPGFVSLGCIACKGSVKQSEFSSLRCMRSDMVTGDQFLEESIWDTSDSRFTKEPFSIWAVDNRLGTFLVRSGFKKPPRRFALKLVDPEVTSGSDDMVIDAEVRTFSAALFDDYGGLMTPLFNVSLSSIGFSLHGRPDHLNTTVSFSLAATSYNDKYEAWEPLVEPVDGVLRYQYDLNSPGAASQLRLTSTRDLNVNITVSNCNMLLQAYASWNNLSQTLESSIEKEIATPRYRGRPMIDIHHKRNYFVVPQNKLGQDIFIRATEMRGLPNIIKMPSGEMKPLKVPVSKNMLDSHLKGNLYKKLRTMVTFIIAEAEFPRFEGLASHQYAVAICLTYDQSLCSGSNLSRQSARTAGASCDVSVSSDHELVKWNEIFFFKVDAPDHYKMELIATDLGKGDPVGYFSAPLGEITGNADTSDSTNSGNGFKWLALSSADSVKMAQENKSKNTFGRIKCAVILSSGSGEGNSGQHIHRDKKSGFIQISPTREGPWTNVALNYSARAACWPLGNVVVASEVSVEDGNRYVNIRSLVSVRNNSELSLDLRLKLGASNNNMNVLDDATKEIPNDEVETDESFESEKYDPTIGWVGCAAPPKLKSMDLEGSSQGSFKDELPSGWRWVDDWHLDTTSVNTADGWVYAPDFENLKWPESYNPLKFVNYVRQRRWVRNRKHEVDVVDQQIIVGRLKPGDSVPLPLSGLTHPGLYVLQFKPFNPSDPQEYSWSSVMDKPSQSEDFGNYRDTSEIYVSSLNESEELLCCSEIGGTSSNRSSGIWFCLTIEAMELTKDIHSNPVQDWSIVVKSPLSITNYLPLTSEYSVLEMQTSGHFVACSRGVFSPGETVKVFNADIRKPLYFSLLPQKGWLPIHEAILISHPSIVPSKTISLRSSISGRVVKVLLEQNHDKERPLLAKTVRVYSSFWISVSRCPPLTFRLLDMSGKSTRNPFKSKKPNKVILEEITDEEVHEGYTIASTLNFNLLGLSASISESGKEHFGPVKDLAPLGDLDGSFDVCAYDADGNCMLLFISSKPCPYQSAPTKVISVRPFVTFTNRLGQDMFLKLSSEDQPKLLRASDARVSFSYRETGEPNKLQVRLENTEWSFPIQIAKEDTIFLVLKKNDGDREFLRTEIRGYEEGSRFTVVFRRASRDGPIRVENRTASKTIRFRQSGFGGDAWIELASRSTTKYSWEDPYGHRVIDTEVHSSNGTAVDKLELDKPGFCTAFQGGAGLYFHVVELGDIKVAKFIDDTALEPCANEGNISSTSAGNHGRNNKMQSTTSENTSPLELIVELGVVGVSFVDHRPKELSYFYLERVFISYSTGYDGGTTSRFKLILGNVQLDNQLPLTLMPVLLAPEQAPDMHHPVFKMTITIRNEIPDGIQVYPYVYIRVADKSWRLNIHEPIIWALVDFYKNLQLDRIPQSSNTSQVDPEIRVDLIDVSEVRLKLSLETAPGQRPHGVLGVWSPILSAVGNAFKIQLHLRKVVHKDRFMRKSSVMPAIGNRIWRDLIHNPLHLIFSVDVLGMTSSTLASLSKGFAELSTDGQFLHLRSKQVWSRRITGVGDGFIQGTEALAQGVAFGVSGVVRKPVESARQNGILGLAHGLGRAFLGVIVQPVSGALDFFSLTVDGIGASCSSFLEVLQSKTMVQRIRNPRAIRADNVLREYSEREAVGQMILYLAEASRRFGCTDIFKEPSKFAWSDLYQDHFVVPNQRIVLVTNKRVMLLQCLAPDKMDKKPCKILWDVPWEELLSLELAKSGLPRPSHLILHLKSFRKAENFVRVIKCSTEDEVERREPQAVRICMGVRKMWKFYQSHLKSLVLKVPSSQGHVSFAWNEADWRETRILSKAVIKSINLTSSSSTSDERKFVKHTINFSKVWSSELESKSRCTLCKKQASEDGGICSIWRPTCPDGFISVGDIARAGTHPPNAAAVYINQDNIFALPVGYDLVWRNCADDYVTPLSIWHPRAPEGYVSVGCVAVPSFSEPEPYTIFCVAESAAESASFEEQKIWSAPESYPWACHIYQVQSDALHFVALRQVKEESDWNPMRVIDNSQYSLKSQSESE